ncbi:hypothetical protein CkaCkLH20_07907 [Colletotrichum karsti]|uniref:Fungal N-terminal domain-containing protein n=1 Tax=Colletotrichum karsti TaxID=1095194 RepID=A0A9P6LJE5_9PEZI|nr:uncharacterized protein CkaCkLH20_07907 [Colletotrichum karsti]KAF9874770.1 hypothetical protein CkaCkLH20_07907 [Colletotrichum karsti]
MADLGTVVGVVSLSLQVFEYVHTYVDALQGRKEDLASTTRHCETMHRLLEQTKTLQEKYSTSPNLSSVAVKQAVSATVTEMTLLRDLVAKIAPDHSQPKSIAGRLDKQKQRMLYPFRRPHLEQLDERLARANEALQSTLQLAVLETTTETGDFLKNVQMDLESSRVEMSDKLDNLQDISKQGRNAITSSLVHATSADDANARDTSSGVLS